MRFLAKVGSQFPNSGDFCLNCRKTRLNPSASEKVGGRSLFVLTAAILVPTARITRCAGRPAADEVLARWLLRTYRGTDR
jgi:hypothetical protein